MQALVVWMFWGMQTVFLLDCIVFQIISAWVGTEDSALIRFFRSRAAMWIFKGLKQILEGPSMCIP